MGIPKRKILLSLPIALMSTEIYLGILLGYLVGRFCGGKKTGEQGIFKSLTLSVGKYRFHLHHWFCGSGIALSAIFFNFSLPWPQLSFGILSGVIFQGVLSYSDWYRIIKKS